MTEKLDERELCELTEASRRIAMAECIPGLGCAVYAEGQELPPWACYRVEGLLGRHAEDGAVIGTGTAPRYFILKRDPETDSFEFVSGPFSGADARRQWSVAKVQG